MDYYMTHCRVVPKKVVKGEKHMYITAKHILCCKIAKCFKDWTSRGISHKSSTCHPME